MLGYPEGCCTSAARWDDFVHPEDLPLALAAVERHKSGATPHYQAELRCQTQDGRWRRLSVRGRVLERDAQGQAPSMAGTFNDITERHELQLALREAQTVFDRSDEGIMFCDAELRITKINPALCAITGYSPSEVIGQTPRLFSSGRHDAAFYAGMWASLKQHGRWRGEIWNQRKNGEVYAEILSISVVRDAEGAVLHYIAVFTDVSLLKRHEEELERMLHYDPLTGVANRRLLTDRLQQALARARRSGKPLAVGLLDLDGFRQANERHGEDAGNRLLVGVAQHLQAVLRADDTLARLGGDEFVLLLTELHSTQECLQVLDRVLAAARLPVALGEGLQLGLSASVGVTLFPDDDADPDTLLRHADQAMFQAKDAGRDRYQLFDPEAERRAQAQRSELLRLQQAYEASEFVLFYQPKVELADGRLTGAEALIRWQHPERGLLPPGEFLPYLPGSTLELLLGQWVLEQAWDQAARWHAQGAALCMGVNISAHELLAPGFATRLAATLARHPGVPTALLELEVLESAAIGDMTQAVAVMRECRSLGVRFALDDFGTGYSSLSYLRQLPVDVIKVDQSFIRNMLASPSDLEIVVGVIGLARAFHLEAVAEGVETLEHAQALRRMGCQLAQGYGIARPLPQAAFEAWRAQWQGLPGAD
ncbi:MAG: EAL domain-containing protein [Inhella sp.]